MPSSTTTTTTPPRCQPPRDDHCGFDHGCISGNQDGDSQGRKGACCPSPDGHPVRGGIGNDCHPRGHGGDSDDDHGNGGGGQFDKSVTLRAGTIAATSPARGSIRSGAVVIGGALMLAGLIGAGMVVRRRLRIW
jgi:hypothetical protein